MPVPSPEAVSTPAEEEAEDGVRGGLPEALADVPCVGIPVMLMGPTMIGEEGPLPVIPEG